MLIIIVIVIVIIIIIIIIVVVVITSSSSSSSGHHDKETADDNHVIFGDNYLGCGNPDGCQDDSQGSDDHPQPPGLKVMLVLLDLS